MMFLCVIHLHIQRCMLLLFCSLGISRCVFSHSRCMSGLLSHFSTLNRTTKIMKAFSIVFISLFLYFPQTFTSGPNVNVNSARELRKREKPDTSRAPKLVKVSKAPKASKAPKSSKASRELRKREKPDTSRAPKLVKASKAPKSSKAPKASKAPKIRK